MTRRSLAAAALFVVSACAGGPAPEMQWTKRDATPEDVKRDIYWCSTERRSPLRIDRTGGEITERRETVLRIDEDCMKQRGYAKR